MFEIEKNKKEFVQKSKILEEEFDIFYSILLKKIKIIPEQEYLAFKEQSKNISPDEKDWPYFALAILLKCPIWTNDQELKKQNKMEIISTNELKEILEKRSS